MKRLPGVPGPGEDGDPANEQAEARHSPTPEGEIPGQGGGVSAGVELTQQLWDKTEAVERDTLADLRRGSTDRALLFTATFQGTGATEFLYDTSAEEIPRETVIDPAQDSAGSQPEL